MTAVCASAIKGRVVRVVTLDTCGNPVTGASSSVIVTAGFINIKFTPAYEDGTEYMQKRADGRLCVNEKSPSEFKRAELELTFCVLDPDLHVVLGGGRLIQASAATGVGAAFGEGVNSNRYSIELWQDVSGRNACDTQGNPQYIYWAFPNCGDGKISDYTVEDGISQFKVTGVFTEAVGPLWGDGPSTTKWLEEALVAGDHYAWNITSTAPPDEACGAALLS